MPRLLLLALVLALLSELWGCQPTRTDTNADTAERVLFVCEHGSVKSLIAASLFDRAAAARGLPVRAGSRGMSPDDGVPPRIAAALRQDGFEVERFRPQRLSLSDIAAATRVVAIGVDLALHGAASRAPIQYWNDVPAASVDYPAARAALERRIAVLLDELQIAGR